jgi:hypothetical protein
MQDAPPRRSPAFANQTVKYLTAQEDSTSSVPPSLACCWSIKLSNYPNDLTKVEALYQTRINGKEVP